MTNDELDVWLHGTRTGTLARLRNGALRLRFTDDALDRWGERSRPLSLSLPLTTRRTEGPEAERYFAGLLPESALRSQLEREHGLRPGDTFGLLRVLGAECAGAVQILPSGETPRTGLLHELTEAEVARIVADLPTLPVPNELPVGASLGGVQAKVLLTRTSTGWAWPLDGAMSTHIVKPEPLDDRVVPDLVRLEDWTMRLARAAGLAAASTTVEDFTGRTALVVERFDRKNGARLHQEDLAQGLGIDARDKYEAARLDGHLARIAALAQEHAADPGSFLATLLEQVTFNVVVGNGDAHAKNYSYFIDDTALARPAPLYDTAAVHLVVPRFNRSGLAVNGRTRLDYLRADDLVAEGAAWGMPPARASDLVAGLIARIREAVAGMPDDPAGIADALVQRLDAVSLHRAN